MCECGPGSPAWYAAWLCAVWNNGLQYKLLPRAYAAGLSNWFCPASGVRRLSVIKKKFLLPGELEPLAISEHEVSDDIRRILACVYLVEQ